MLREGLCQNVLHDDKGIATDAPHGFRKNINVNNVKFKRTVLLSLIMIMACAQLAAQTQKGKASYYSKRATGARTSSGERLHHDSLTCAHKTYPFGTLLKVTNPNNGKEIVVRVTDRGPHRRGRIIDLSWGAAKQLGILNHGVAMVTVEVVDKNKIPFRPEPMEMPEIDFELTSGARYASAEWAKKEVQKVKRINHHISSPNKKDMLITAKAENPAVADRPARAERIR